MRPNRGVALFLCTLLWACESPVHVRSATDPSARFDTYTSWAWRMDGPMLPATIPISGSEVALDPTLEGHIKSALAEAMSALGYRRVDRATADLLLRFAVAGEQRVQVHDSSRRAAITVWEFTEGSLILDALDAQTQRRVWQGVATRDIWRGEDTAAIARAIATSLAAEFPPRQVPE